MKQFHHFIELTDYDGQSLERLLDKATAQKARLKAGKLAPLLPGRTLAMIFEKPSLRTRLSFEVAMTQLGGHAIHMTQADIGLGKREAIKDAARVIARICDAIMIRTFAQQDVREMASNSSVPVINALTDYSHPCQAMADMMTVREHFGSIRGRKLAFVGDGNNVARSLANACGLLGMRFAMAAPEGYQLESGFLERLGAMVPQLEAQMHTDPIAAVQDADVVYTDTWTSMGQEQQQEQRRRVFRTYQVNAELLSHAPERAVVMHCLPAHRGAEITDEVLDSERSVVFQQAENRLHFQRCLLSVVMAGQ